MGGGGGDMVRLKHIYAKIHRIRFIFGYLVLVLHICINWVLEKSSKISRCSWVIFFSEIRFPDLVAGLSNMAERSHIEYN